MKKQVYTILATALFAANTYAQVSVSPGFEWSNDSDHNTVFRAKMSTPINDVFSIGVNRTRYNNPGGTFNGTEVVSDVSYKSDKHFVFGFAGLGNVKSTTYLFSDITYMYAVNESLYLNAGLAGGIVDSEVGLQTGITTTGVNAGLDYENSVGGVSLSTKYDNYTDGNNQTGYNAKLFLNVVDGANVYVSTKNTDNSRPFNSNYYSPDSTTKYNVGVGFRHEFDYAVVSGFAETGRATASGEKFNVHEWKLNVSATKNAPLPWVVTLGQVTNSYNYFYNYVNASLVYTF